MIGWFATDDWMVRYWLECWLSSWLTVARVFVPRCVEEHSRGFERREGAIGGQACKERERGEGGSKKEKNTCLFVWCVRMPLQPRVDLAHQTLTISAPSIPTSLVVSLQGSAAPPPQAHAAQRHSVRQGGDVQGQAQGQAGLVSSASPPAAAQGGSLGARLLAKLGLARGAPHEGALQPQQDTTAASAAAVAPGAHGAAAARGAEEVIQVCGDRVCGMLVATQVSACHSTGGDGKGAGGGGSSTGAAAACSSGGGDGQDGEELVRAWFAEAVGAPCRLVRQTQGARTARPGTAGRGPKQNTAGAAALSWVSGAGEAAEQQGGQQRQQAVQGGPQGGATQSQSRALVGFANDGQFLLVNAASVQDVNARIVTAAGATRDGFMPATGGSPVELLR